MATVALGNHGAEQAGLRKRGDIFLGNASVRFGLRGVPRQQAIQACGTGNERCTCLSIGVFLLGEVFRGAYGHGVVSY